MSLVPAGHGRGSSIPGTDEHLLPIAGLIVVVSLLPLAIELGRSRWTGKHHQNGPL